MIKGFVQGQTLRLAQTRVVADSIDYLIAKFSFQGEDWRGLEKWMHLQQGEQLYVIQLNDDRTQKSDHLNLSAGEWAVWLHGNVSESGTVTQRITTNICTFTVEQSGALEGDAMPELPASIGEQLQARIAVLEANEGGLPVIGENDEGKVLTAVDGAWEPREIEIASAVTVDSALSETSENPVQNKVITQIVQEANAAMTELGSTIDILSAHATPSVSTADNGKILQVVDGAWAAADAPGAGASITVDNELSETSENPVQNKVITAAFLEASGVLMQFGEAMDAIAPQLTPAVTAQDDGKILQVVDGAWAALPVADSAVKTYIDEYINEALGGDY